jgi:hypothetical protein
MAPYRPRAAGGCLESARTGTFSRVRLVGTDANGAALDFAGRVAVVGSGGDADLVLDRPGVAPQHARFAEDRIEALADCLVGGVLLRAGATRRLLPGTSVQLGDATFVVDDGENVADTRELALRAVATGAVLQPTILVVEGTDRGKRLALGESRSYSVGRSEACDLVLGDSSVSRMHLAIERTAERVLLRDLGSTGGVFLGEARLEPGRRALWSRRTMVRIGRVVLGLALPIGWSEVDDAEGVAPATSSEEDRMPPSLPPASLGESVPSLRVATSACEANIADVPPTSLPAPKPRARRPYAWVVPAALVLFMIVMLAVVVYIVVY